MLVITAGHERELFAGAPPRLFRRAMRFWRAQQDELATLSPDDAHVIALRSDHFIQRADQQPDVVIRAIRAVTRAVRDNSQLPPCKRLFSGPDVRCLS